MDNKTVFIRTKRGEDEMQGKTTHLPGDIKRALLMVDGDATFGEISKRAAPSLRSSLDEMFRQLEKDGFIQDKIQGQIVSEHIPKMAVPVKIATPNKSQPAGQVDELNFMAGFAASQQDAPAVKAEKSGSESFDKSRQDIEVAKFIAQQGAEAKLLKAEQEAARIRGEAVRRAKAEADVARIKAGKEAEQRLEAAARARQQAEAERIKGEQETVQMRIEQGAAKARAELEAKARLEETTAKAHARIEAEDDAATVREEAERIIRKEKEEARAREAREREARELEAARVREEAERIIRKEKEEAMAREAREREAARIREEAERVIRKEQEEARAREAREREARELEAARVREEAERIIRKEQEEARAREAQALKEARVREEVERIRKQEQEEARAREAQALKEARVREEVERIMRQEQEEARAREAAAGERAARTTAPAGESSAFSFDSFQVDDPLYTSESHKENKSGKKVIPPAKKVSPAPAAPAGKPGSFAFDSFNVDEHLQPPQQQKNKQPEQKTAPVQQPAPASRAAQARQPDNQQQEESTLSNKPIVGKPSKEQIKRAEQERIAVEKRMAAEALAAKKMAEEQAKVWAEAENRALGIARSDVDQIARHATFTVDDSPAVRAAPVARVRRKQFSWGRLAGFFFKLGLFLLVLLVGALYVIPYVLPMRDYMPKAEQMLSEKLQQPVHVGRLSGRFLPTPRIELGEIYIGDAKQFQADVAQINFSFMGLLTDIKPVSSIEFQGVKVRGAWLKNTSVWLQKMASDPQYPVSRMVIANGALDADVFELTGIEGDLDFDPDGKFTRANLHANAGKYALGIDATPENNLNIALTVRDSALPLLPNWTFELLTAKGALSNGDLKISNFDARMLGGVLQGNAVINWRSGWSAQGALSAKSIKMQMLDKLLDGTIEGSARFRMASAGLGGLTDSVALEGNFNSKGGIIGGMEIADTARKHSKENLPGGRTNYDELTGVVSFDNGVYHFKQAKITASALSATATFDVDASNQLSGNMNVSLSIHDRTSSPVELQMGGTVDSPTLIYSP
ncbi:MAG: AsmA family protein [Gallionella sp.]